MKKVILGAALCSTAVALAGAANADGADGDFLSGSTNALILGSTGIPTPNAAYITGAENLYLDANGYDGTTATTLALTTPETYDFTTSVTQGEQDLVNAVVADYDAGDIGCNAGVCSDPLTIFTYSQSSAIAALAEQQLAADNIPDDALRFVMTGADPLGVPNDLYPTEVYNIDGDFWVLPGSLGTTWQDIELELVQHFAYLWLTPAEIDAATSAVNGMTTVFDMPTLSIDELWDALINAAIAGF
jgi:hypothetical protein